MCPGPSFGFGLAGYRLRCLACGYKRDIYPDELELGMQETVIRPLVEAHIRLGECGPMELGSVSWTGTPENETFGACFRYEWVQAEGGIVWRELPLR